MSAHPAIVNFIGKLSPLPGTAFQGSLTDIGDLGDNVAHLRIVDVRQREEVYSFDLVASRNGVRLIELAGKLQPSGGVQAIVFLEFNEGDRVSQPYFNYAIADDAEDDLLRIVRSVEHVLRSTLGGMSQSDFRKLVSNVQAQESMLSGNLVAFGLEKLADAYGLFNNLLAKLVELINLLKAPEQIYKDELRSESLDATIRSAGRRLIDLTKDAIELVDGLPALAVSEDFDAAVDGQVGGILQSVLPDWVKTTLDVIRGLLRAIEEAWLKVRRFVKGVAHWVSARLPRGENVSNAFVGYLSGLWDGLLDAVIGFIETGQLALTLMAAEMRRQSDPMGTMVLINEATDQIAQTYERLNISAIWTHFTDEIYPQLAKLVEEELDRFDEDLAQSGYYVGYLAYNIAEMLFPPIKLTKFAKGLSTAGEAARRFAQVAN